MTTVSSSTTGSIISTLGAGSTLDTGALVTSLVSASYDPKLSDLTKKETANTSKISSLGTLSNKIDSFSNALTSLISGGTLFTQPTSSDSSVLTATAKAGGQIGSLSAQVSVRQLAQAQSLVSGYYASSSAAVGTGSLTLTTGDANFNIAITSGNNTLAGVARAINARTSDSGVTASVVSDGTGARLMLKGQTGAANSFSLTAAANADGGLAGLNYDAPTMQSSSTAVVSPYLSASTNPVGQGSYTLTYGGVTNTVTIDASNDSLDGLAAAITAQGNGLTATVASDANGSYMSITDASGSTPSFTMTPVAGGQAGQRLFAWPVSTTGMTRVQTAQDAIVRMDGVDVTRSGNTIDDLVDGVTLKLLSAAPTQTVTLGAQRPTDAIKQAVSDFVDAYNEMKSNLDSATAASVTADDGTVSRGPLYGNAGIRNMQTQLARLTSTVLSTSGGPQTLAEIGVSTNRDGTLALNSDKLSAMLTSNPDGVEALFNPTQHSSSPLIKITSDMGRTKPGTYQLGNIVAATGSTNASGMIAGYAASPIGTGLYASVSSLASGLRIEASGDVASATITVDLGLGGALKAIRDQLQATNGIFTTLKTQFSSEKTTLATQRTKIEDQESAYKTRLTTQFATMDSNVSNYKATQSYLTQQIALWTKDDS